MRGGIILEEPLVELACEAKEVGRRRHDDLELVRCDRRIVLNNAARDAESGMLCVNCLLIRAMRAPDDHC